MENVALEKGEISLELDDLSRCDGMIGNGNIFGPTLLKYAKKMNSAGQLHAERLLLNQLINQLFSIGQKRREEIPQEWQDFELIFPGTVWRAPNGNLLIPTLKWICTNDWRWNLIFSFLHYNFSANTRMVCIHK
ncbi:MAG: hypothetical protein PHT40_01245 [Patescibacteria group bacterium]|nr:hypothetical protein [Patescibacteria group bacterium]